MICEQVSIKNNGELSLRFFEISIVLNVSGEASVVPSVKCFRLSVLGYVPWYCVRGTQFIDG